MEPLTIIDEERREYERAVTRQAKEVAETHVMDVLCVVEAGLRQLRFNYQPGHDGKVTSKFAATEQGRKLLKAVLELLPDEIEIDYQGVVNECDEECLLLMRDEYVISDTRDHVQALMEKMSAEK